MMTPDELHTSRLSDMMTRLADIRASAAGKGDFKSKEFASLLLGMERDLESWTQELPQGWKFVTHDCSRNENVYENSYISYTSPSIAAAWNDYRTLRCIVNDIMLTHIDSIRLENASQHGADLLKERQRAIDTIKRCCTETCLSTPFVLGRFEDSRRPKTGAGDLQMMWALFVCSCMHCIPEAQRIWAVKQLESIGHQMGIHQALPLAELMKSKLNLIKSPEVATKSGWENTILTKSWYEELRRELFLGA